MCADGRRASNIRAVVWNVMNTREMLKDWLWKIGVIILTVLKRIWK